MGGDMPDSLRSTKSREGDGAPLPIPLSGLKTGQKQLPRVVVALHLARFVSVSHVCGGGARSDDLSEVSLPERRGRWTIPYVNIGKALGALA